MLTVSPVSAWQRGQKERGKSPAHAQLASLHAALLLAASLPPNSGWGMCSAAARAYMTYTYVCVCTYTYVYIYTHARVVHACARGGGGGFKLTCARKLFPKTKHLRFCMLCDTHCLCVSCNTAEEVQLISCCGADK